VFLKDLRSKPELNGTKVYAESFDANSGRYSVVLPSDRLLAIQPKNLDEGAPHPDEASAENSFLPQIIPLVPTQDSRSGSQSFLPRIIPLGTDTEQKENAKEISQDDEAVATIALIVNVGGKEQEVGMPATSTISNLKTKLFEDRHTDLLAAAQKLVMKGAVISNDHTVNTLVDTGARGRGHTIKLMLLRDTSYAPPEVKVCVSLPNASLRPSEFNIKPACTIQQLKLLLQTSQQFPSPTSFVLFHRKRGAVLTDDARVQACMSPEHVERMASRHWRECKIKIQLLVVPKVAMLISATCNASREQLERASGKARGPWNERGQGRGQPQQQQNRSPPGSHPSSRVPTIIRTGLAQEFGPAPTAGRLESPPDLPISWGMGLEYERHPLLCPAIANAEEQREQRVVEEELLKEGAGWAAELEPGLEVVQTRILQNIAQQLDALAGGVTEVAGATGRAMATAAAADSSDSGSGEGSGKGSGVSGRASDAWVCCVCSFLNNTATAQSACEMCRRAMPVETKSARKGITPQLDRFPMPDNMAFSWVMALQAEEEQRLGQLGKDGEQREESRAAAHEAHSVGPATAKYFRLLKEASQAAVTAGGGEGADAGAAGGAGGAETTKVKIRGLRCRPELNGTVGVIKGFDQSSGRFKVRLMQTGKLVALQPINVTLAGVAGAGVAGAGIAGAGIAGAGARSNVSASSAGAQIDERGAREALQEISQHPASEKALSTLKVILRNITKVPSAAKYRSIRLGNPRIQEHLVRVPASIVLLKKMGFEEGEGALTLAEDRVDQQIFAAVLQALEAVTAGDIVGSGIGSIGGGSSTDLQSLTHTEFSHSVNRDIKTGAAEAAALGAACESSAAEAAAVRAKVAKKEGTKGKKGKKKFKELMKGLTASTSSRDRLAQVDGKLAGSKLGKV
jgi:hypothetical protein